MLLNARSSRFVGVKAGLLPRRSLLAADQTARAASALIARMPRPTMRSGHADKVYAVTNPAAMIATFATASLRADKNAARVKLPLCDRKRARMNAHEKLMSSAPKPVIERGIGAGGSGAINFCHAADSLATPGISKVPARAIPKRARFIELQPRPKPT